MEKSALSAALRRVRQTTPLVHSITNYVTVNDCANALLACGIREEERIVCRVRGNCDRASLEPETIVREFGGVRFLITHGHEQNVKYGLWGLVDEAKKRNCKAALFGHTHRKTFLVKEGITLINPGSAAGGSYCLLEAENGIVKEPARQE